MLGKVVWQPPREAEWRLVTIRVVSHCFRFMSYLLSVIRVLVNETLQTGLPLVTAVAVSCTFHNFPIQKLMMNDTELRWKRWMKIAWLSSLHIGTHDHSRSNSKIYLNISVTQFFCMVTTWSELWQHDYIGRQRLELCSLVWWSTWKESETIQATRARQ